MQTLDELMAVLNKHGSATEGVFTDKAMLVGALSDALQQLAALKRRLERQFLFNDVFMERFHIFTRHKCGCTWDDSEKGDVCTCGLQALITMYYELADTREPE